MESQTKLMKPDEDTVRTNWRVTLQANETTRRVAHSANENIYRETHAHIVHEVKSHIKLTKPHEESHTVLIKPYGEAHTLRARWRVTHANERSEVPHTMLAEQLKTT